MAPEAVAPGARAAAAAAPPVGLGEAGDTTAEAGATVPPVRMAAARVARVEGAGTTATTAAALANLAVLVSGSLVFWLDSRWPDLLVALAIASLFTHSALSILRQVNNEQETDNCAKEPMP